MSQASERYLVRESTIDISIQRIVSAQFIAAILISAVAVVIGLPAAGSALLGGLSIALPSVYMAWRLRRNSAVPSVALAQLLGAELGKWLLTGLIIGAVFVWVESLQAGFFFLGLIATYVCGLVFVSLAAAKHRVES